MARPVINELPVIFQDVTAQLEWEKNSRSLKIHLYNLAHHYRSSDSTAQDIHDTNFFIRLYKGRLKVLDERRFADEFPEQ